jgi:urease subunit gamma/beta
VYLTPTEEARLLIFTAAELARRSRADGLWLSAAEATALACDEMHRAARAGAGRDGVLAAGRAAVDPAELMDGVADLVPEIRLEVLLGDGTRLVVLRHPWGPGVAGRSRGPGGTRPVIPGEIRSPDAAIALSPGRPRLSIQVTNTSARPVRVSSHYPFWQVNPRLEFDRTAAAGYRLDIPAGASVRWAPGEVRQVDLVASLAGGGGAGDTGGAP